LYKHTHNVTCFFSTPQIQVYVIEITVHKWPNSPIGTLTVLTVQHRRARYISKTCSNSRKARFELKHSPAHSRQRDTTRHPGPKMLPHVITYSKSPTCTYRNTPTPRFPYLKFRLFSQTHAYTEPCSRFPSTEKGEGNKPATQ
jgi:hypothetical protein